jgi:hypothetical protein
VYFGIRSLETRCSVCASPDDYEPSQHIAVPSWYHCSPTDRSDEDSGDTSSLDVDDSSSIL